MNMGRGLTRRAASVLVCCGLVAASCSLVGDGAEPDREQTAGPAATMGSGAADGSDQTDDQETDGEPPEPGMIWTRHDPAAFLPDGPQTQFRGALAADETTGWTVVGAVFDFETTQSTAATWESSDPGSGNWTRSDVSPRGEEDETMIGIARVGRLEVAVGSRGEVGDLQPAVWSRTIGGPWISFESTQLTSEDSEYIHSLAVQAGQQQMVMAIGQAETDNGIMIPTLWDSADGKSWRRSSAARFATDGSESAFGIAGGPDRWVMAGRRNRDDGSYAPTIWHSTDGNSWAKVELPLNDGDLLGSANAVIWTGDQFVAVGEASSDLAAEPRSWVSPNGEDWSESSADFGLNLEGRITSAGFGASTVSAAGGRLVAAANIGFVQQIWESNNGLSWTPVGDIWQLRNTGVGVLALTVTDDELLLATEDQALLHYDETWQISSTTNAVAPNPSEAPFVRQVEAVDDGFVAVGGFQRSSPTDGSWLEGRSWFSPDGIDWTEMQPHERSSWGELTSVANADGEAVAVGGQSLRDADQKQESAQSMLWEGSGSQWTVREESVLAAPDEARVFLQAVDAVGPDLVAGGWYFPNEAPAADAYLIASTDGGDLEVVETEYTGPGDESVTAICNDGNGTSVAMIQISESTTRAAALVRDPGGEWSTGQAGDGSFDSAPLIQINSCTYGAGRFVAAGWTSPDRVGTDVGLWQSTDGADWTAVDGPPEFTSDADQWIASMVAVDSGFLIAGVDTASGLPQPIIWYGDGDTWLPVPLGEDALGMDTPYISVRDGVVLVIGTVDGAPRTFTAELDVLLRAAGQ